MNKEDRVCDYIVSLKLKEAGYDDGCECFWATDIRHNGEYLGCDEEYELRAEGRGDEIEYIPGGRLTQHWNYNDDFSDDEETCSAPDIYDAIEWLRVYRGIIVETNFSLGDNRFRYTITVRSENKVIHSDESWEEPIWAIKNALMYLTTYINII